jgi:hypothetical protein
MRFVRRVLYEDVGNEPLRLIMFNFVEKQHTRQKTVFATPYIPIEDIVTVVQKHPICYSYSQDIA